jgi:hypothetical protein
MIDEQALVCQHCHQEVDGEFGAYQHVCVDLRWRKRLALWLDSRWWLARFHLRRLRCRLQDHQFTAYPFVILPDGVKPGRTCRRCGTTFYDPPIRWQTAPDGERIGESMR